MRKPQGYSVIYDPDRPTVEHDCYTCSHCQKIVEVEPRCDPADAGGFCRVCGSLICKFCVGKECVPIRKAIEEQLERQRRQIEYVQRGFN